MLDALRLGHRSGRFLLCRLWPTKGWSEFLGDYAGDLRFDNGLSPRRISEPTCSRLPVSARIRLMGGWKFISVLGQNRLWHGLDKRFSRPC